MMEGTEVAFSTVRTSIPDKSSGGKLSRKCIEENNSGFAVYKVESATTRSMFFRD